MKKQLLLIISLLLFQGLHSQNVEKSIQEIRKHFKWINSQKMKIYFLENEEFTDDVATEGSGLDMYFQNDTIYKLVRSDATSNNVFTTEYYLYDGKLFFVFYKEKTYTRNYDTHEIDGIKVNFEERTYFDNDKIIRHLTKGKSVLNKRQDFKKQFDEIYKYADFKVKHLDMIEKLEGMWINEEGINDNFEFWGLVARQYSEHVPTTYRWYYDGRYLWFHNTENTDANDLKYELLSLTKDKMEVQDRLSGEYKIYEKR